MSIIINHLLIIEIDDDIENWRPGALPLLNMV